jgi:hypothetical protein
VASAATKDISLLSYLSALNHTPACNILKSSTGISGNINTIFFSESFLSRQAIISVPGNPRLFGKPWIMYWSNFATSQQMKPKRTYYRFTECALSSLRTGLIPPSSWVFSLFHEQTIIVMSRLIEYDMRKEIYDHYQALMWILQAQ